MNCREFDSLICDLAAEREIDGGARRSALAHALSCRDCAARLARERSVEAGLRAYAESTDSEQAPPRLKESLMAAFAAQQRENTAGAQPSTAAAQPSTVAAPVLAFRSSAPRRHARAALAIAAGILLLAAASSLFWMGGSADEPRQMVVIPDATPTPAPSPSPSPSRRTIETKKEAGKPAPQKRRTVRRPPAYVAKNTVVEETTAFIPLTYAGGGGASEGGMIVRVEVPRATLVALGLPLDPVRGESRVTADLLVGDDGITRAIRLVQ